MARSKNDPLARWRTDPSLFEMSPWNGDTTLSRIESYCLWYSDPRSNPDQKYNALRMISYILWEEDRDEPAVVWHPYMTKMGIAHCQNRMVFFGGAGGTGKSFFLGMIALVLWLSAYSESMVLFISESISGSRRRGWGTLTELMGAARLDGEPFVWPGDLLSASNKVRMRKNDPDFSDKAGIHLLAGSSSKAKESLGKLIGSRAPRVVLLLDECTELTESLYLATTTNLVTNTDFYCLAAGNPKSLTDCFGLFCEPEEGWESVDAGSAYEWDCKMGRYFRLSCHESPNLEEEYEDGKEPFPYLPRRRTIENAIKVHGKNSRAFGRMFEAIWPVGNEADTLYNEMGLYTSGVFNPPTWTVKPDRIMAIDLSFAAKGDSTIAALGWVGTNSAGQRHLHIDATVVLKEMARSEKTRTTQILEQIQELMSKHGVTARGLALDSTSAAKTFLDMARERIGREVLGVDFAGKASHRPASLSDKTPAHKRYKNRMSELWLGVRELMEGKQFSMVRDQDLVMQFTKRQMDDEVVSGAEKLLAVEPKLKFRQRHGFSPDKADAVILTVELAKERFGLQATHTILVDSKNRKSFRELARKFDVASRSDPENSRMPEFFS
jgi:hypothetical protein